MAKLNFTTFQFETMTFDELDKACGVLSEEMSKISIRRRQYTGIETEIKLVDAWFRYRKAQQEADKALRDIVTWTDKRATELSRE